MRAKMYRLSALLAAGLLVGGIALGAGQTLAQSNSGGGKSSQLNARQKESVGGGAGAHDVNSKKANMQRQKAMKSGAASDNGPPKTVP
jgi:hypothetical protein